MIILDSSILVAVIKGEESSRRLLQVLAAEQCAIGVPTLVETRAWCAINLGVGRSAWLEDFISRESVAIIPFGRDMADVASRAFARFGKGSGHPARLNFGDCMAYATSAVMRARYYSKGTISAKRILPHTRPRYRPDGSPACRERSVRDEPQASPTVSNSTLSNASCAVLPAQTTNWKAWK